MVEKFGQPHRQQDLYLTEVLQLKIACEYMRLYRDAISRRLTAFSALRAVASSGAIATWAVVKSYPLLWGSIIALSQVADALRDVFPLAARYKATHGAAASLDALLIEVLFEAEGVYAGNYSDAEITQRRRKLMRLHHEVMVKHFPNENLPVRQRLFLLAKNAGLAYFNEIFGARMIHEPKHVPLVQPFGSPAR